MGKALPSLAKEKWLQEPNLQKLLHVIADAGGEARIAGGAVRNALLGEPVTEIDIATNLQPDQVIHVCKAAKFAVHPTGIDHGTLTVVVHGTPFEVTTLRKDVSTDGRRATVKFTDDWREDALRRDFTINAMYADAAGKIYDYTDGYRDIQNRKVRFVGSAAQRIKEDYLRILRFFRFHARFGKGAPDAAGLAACKRLRKGIGTLSAERIRQEMLKLLPAPAALPTLKVMSITGILKEIIPYTDDWRLIKRLPADGLLRLAVLAKEPKELKSRFRLSNDEGKRISQLFHAPIVSPKLRANEQRRLLYVLQDETWRDVVALSWARSRAPLTDHHWQALLDLPSKWQRPSFPVNGKVLQDHGVPQGPELGRMLRQLEDWWIASDFQPERDELLRKVTK
jgi:poly(A) polymerase